MNLSSNTLSANRKFGAPRPLSALITALLVAAPLTAVSEELVINGGFEEPNLEALNLTNEDGNGWTTFFGQNVGEDYCEDTNRPACHGLIPGWQVFWQDNLPGQEGVQPGRLEVQRGNVAGSLAPEGDQKAELDSHFRVGTDGNFDPALSNNAMIMQELKTCPGTPYTLTYDWLPRPGVDGTVEMLVAIDNQQLISRQSQSGVWESDELKFIASGTGYNSIAFAAVGDGDTLGMLLDNVSVQGQKATDNESCEPPPAVCGDKPARLELLYNGPLGAGGSNSQESGEVIVDTFTGDALPNVVKIKVYDHLYGKRGATELFSGKVDIGESFSFSGTKGKKALIPPKVFIEISQMTGPNAGELLQLVSFHTSCSQPLNVGDQFGGVAVWGFTP